MSERSSYAYPNLGSVYVLGDGPELFVYSAVNDAPLWRQFCEGRIVGVGATRDRVFSVDSDGRLSRWRAIDGAKIDDIDTGVGRAEGLVVANDGTCAVLTRDEVVVGESRRAVRQPGVQVAAFSADSQVLALGSASGTVEFFAVSSGQSVGKFDAPGPVHGLCWRHPGHWLVVANTQAIVVDAKTAKAGTVIELGAPGGPVAAMADGALAAVVSGQDVLILEFHTHQRVGTVRLQRAVHGVSFGPGTWLGLGYDDADANRVDLVTGQLQKSEPHPGRTANRWPIKVECDPMKVRQAITLFRAGGRPIAREVQPEGPAVEKKKGRGCLFWGAVTVGLLFACTGCAGVLGGLYYQFYLPH